jgi:Fungal Zn(2)-Cys(6) binuclear cluster domain
MYIILMAILHLLRTRRVKCDEAKPTCLRCQKFGEVCDGYPTAPSGRPKPKPLLPRSTLKPIPPVPKFISRAPMRSYSIRAQPAPGPDFTTESEYNYFSLYQSSTAAELAGYFSPDVWNRVILQTCHEEAYARHAVIALGALHRALQVYHHSVERASAKLHHSFALQQYGKALKYMSQIVARENEARLRHTADILSPDDLF